MSPKMKSDKNLDQENTLKQAQKQRKLTLYEKKKKKPFGKSLMHTEWRKCVNLNHLMQIAKDFENFPVC